MLGPYCAEVWITHRDGEMVFDAKSGFAVCYIWAEIKARGESNYSISKVYAAREFGDDNQELSGHLRQEAEIMLYHNDDFIEWIADEIYRQIGYREEPYERLGRNQLL